MATGAVLPVEEQAERSRGFLSAAGAYAAVSATAWSVTLGWLSLVAASGYITNSPLVLVLLYPTPAVVLGAIAIAQFSVEGRPSWSGAIGGLVAGIVTVAAVATGVMLLAIAPFTRSLLSAPQMSREAFRALFLPVLVVGLVWLVASLVRGTRRAAAALAAIVIGVTLTAVSWLYLADLDRRVMLVYADKPAAGLFGEDLTQIEPEGIGASTDGPVVAVLFFALGCPAGPLVVRRLRSRLSRSPHTAPV